MKKHVKPCRITSKLNNLHLPVSLRVTFFKKLRNINEILHTAVAFLKKILMSLINQNQVKLVKIIVEASIVHFSNDWRNFSCIY